MKAPVVRARCSTCHIDNRNFDGSTGSHSHGFMPFGDAVILNYKGQRYYPEGGADTVRKVPMMRVA